MRDTKTFLLGSAGQKSSQVTIEGAGPAGLEGTERGRQRRRDADRLAAHSDSPTCPTPIQVSLHWAQPGETEATSRPHTRTHARTQHP